MKIISDYIQIHGDKEREFFDIDNHPFGSDIKDDDVRHAIASKLASYSDRRTARDVLIAMSKSRGWSREDIVLLSALSADDFYKLFKEARENELNSIVLPAMQFARIGGIGEAERSISDKARAALERIGRENDLNRVRVLKYGVSFEGK